MGADQAWRKRFAQGLRSIDEDEKRHYREHPDSELRALFRRGLEHLDHLDRDLYPPESTPPRLDLKIADEPEDTAELYAYANSGQGKRNLLGPVAALLRPLEMHPKPAPAA